MSYMFYGTSISGVSCRRLWLASTTLAGGNFLITTRVLRCLCRSNVVHDPHKLNIDSNRNTIQFN